MRFNAAFRRTGGAARVFDRQVCIRIAHDIRLFGRCVVSQLFEIEPKGMIADADDTFEGLSSARDVIDRLFGRLADNDVFRFQIVDDVLDATSTSEEPLSATPCLSTWPVAFCFAAMPSPAVKSFPGAYLNAQETAAAMLEGPQSSRMPPFSS